MADEFTDVFTSEPVESWLPKTAGETLTGTFVRRDVVNVVDEATGAPEQFAYVLIREGSTPDGIMYRINESYQIGQAFGGVAPGSRVRLTFTGEQKLAKAGRNPMKCYSLAVAKTAAHS